MSGQHDNGVVLSIRNISRHFGDWAAVSDLTLDIMAGEFVTLLGPSGCGKTTLLRMIAGLDQPTSGQIVYEGRDITSVPPERRPFNMVFQSYALFPHLTVFDNVAYGPRLRGVRKSQLESTVRDALTLVGLAEFANRDVRQLSGGMSQRVALARAMVNEPALLLLDEPLGALDLQLRKRMQLELRNLQRRVRSTFVFVTHDQEEALVMSKRIVLMKAGCIEQVGTPLEIYRHPASRFVAEFIGECNFFDGVAVSGGSQVRVDFGERRVSGPHSAGSNTVISPNDEVSLAVRPESCVLVSPGAGVLGRGIATDQIFLGNRNIVEVLLASGTTVRVGVDGGTRDVVGTEVGIDIAAAASGTVVERQDETNKIEEEQ